MRDLVNKTMQTRPIFIIGYMRSGTSLTYNILHRHKDIFSAAVGETQFFDLKPMIRSFFSNLDNDAVLMDFVKFTMRILYLGFTDSMWYRKQQSEVPHKYLECIENVYHDARDRRDYNHIFYLVFNALALCDGKSAWIEKTPTNAFYVEEILRDMPHALFVFLVRDVRDVLASKKKPYRKFVSKRKRKPDKNNPEDIQKGRWEGAFHPLWDALAWKAAIKAVRTAQARYPGRIFQICYEDLVSDPERYVKGICGFLKLEFDRNMLNVTRRNTSYPDVQSTGIATDSVGNWKKVLNEQEIALCELLTKDQMRELGYKSEDRTKLAICLAVIPLLVSGIYEFCYRMYRKMKLGGKLYVISVLRDYLKRLTHLIFPG